ncbi:MAG TPA: hypothetical protein VF152_06995 [Acidimicrobiia bacterium]
MGRKGSGPASGDGAAGAPVTPVSTLAVDGLGRLRRRWTLAFLVGELVGFVPPAVTGASLAAAGVSDAALVVGLTVAGLLEGAALGAAQAWVLARSAPAVDRRAWVLATTAAAGFAWFVGMSGGALAGSAVAPPAVLAAVLAPAWVAALLSMGYAQWLVLRRTVPASGRWVWVTAGAWLLGVMIPVVALSAAPDGWPGWIHAVVGVLAAVAMGLTVGALTGRTLDRLLSP